MFARRIKNVGGSTISLDGAVTMRGWNSEMGRLVMLGEEVKEAKEVREAKEATKDTPLPPCFCVCRGNKEVTGEWLASAIIYLTQCVWWVHDELL